MPLSNHFTIQKRVIDKITNAAPPKRLLFFRSYFLFGKKGLSFWQLPTAAHHNQGEIDCVLLDHAVIKLVAAFTLLLHRVAPHRRGAVRGVAFIFWGRLW